MYKTIDIWTSKYRTSFVASYVLIFIYFIYFTSSIIYVHFKNVQKLNDIIFDINNFMFINHFFNKKKEKELFPFFEVRVHDSRYILGTITKIKFMVIYL